MAFIYTPADLRKELMADPQHADILTFVLKEFDNRSFSLTVESLGIFSRFKGTSNGVVVDTDASDIKQAAEWAKNGLREWAKAGITEPNEYFALIAREWAKSKKDSCTKCLGSTVDFLYFFSRQAARKEGSVRVFDMYEISSSIERDMKGTLLKVFVDWWDVGVVQGLDHTPVKTNQADLHPDFHDSQPGHYDEDQTHHFALYFYVGVKIGAGQPLLDIVLKKTHDLDDNGKIINAGDYYLGITAAKLGDDFDDDPRYIGDLITRVLRNPSLEKQQDLKQDKVSLNDWINEHGNVVHPGAPNGKGGAGRFASAGPLFFVPQPGDLPHHKSPAARSLDPVRFTRFASDRENGVG